MLDAFSKKGSVLKKSIKKHEQIKSVPQVETMLFHTYGTLYTYLFLNFMTSSIRKSSSNIISHSLITGTHRCSQSVSCGHESNSLPQ